MGAWVFLMVVVEDEMTPINMLLITHTHWCLNCPIGLWASLPLWTSLPLCTYSLSVSILAIVVYIQSLCDHPYHCLHTVSLWASLPLFRVGNQRSETVNNVSKPHCYMSLTEIWTCLCSSHHCSALATSPMSHISSWDVLSVWSDYWILKT